MTQKAPNSGTETDLSQKNRYAIFDENLSDPEFHKQVFARPVKVFHMRSESSSAFQDHFAQGEPFLSILCDKIAEMGYSKDDIAPILQDYFIENYAWPKNLNWKSLPVVMEPAFRTSYWHYARIQTYEEKLVIRTLRVVLDNIDAVPCGTEIFIIAAPVLTVRTLASFGRLIDDNHSIKIFHFDGVNLNAIDMSELRKAAKNYAADARFVYNHSINATVMMARAHLKCYRDEGASQAEVANLLGKLDNFGSRRGHPLAVQMLFAIGKLGTPEQSEDEIDVRETMAKLPWLLVNSLPFFQKNTDETFSFVWRGTGAYTPWIENVGEVIDGPRLNARGTWKSEHTILRILSGLYYSNDIGSFNGQMRVTEKGRRFLELIGNDLDDPDVLLRWRTAEAYGGADDVPAMDRWLNRSFRALKRKVSNLPASPLTEDAQSPWPEFPKNYLYIYGETIKIEDIPEEKRADAIKDVLTHEASYDMKDRRCGLVRHHIGFGEPASFSAIWRGVPVCIDNIFIGELDKFTDWATFSQSFPAVDILDVLPWSSERKRGFMTCGLIEGEKCKLNVPTRMIEVGADWAGAEVYQGKMVTIDDIETGDEDVRSYVRSIMAGTMTRRGTDGFVGRIEGKRMQVVHGVIIGYQEDESNVIKLQKQLAEHRRRFLEKRFSEASKWAQGVWGPQNSVQDGIWVIKPNGAFTRLDPTDHRIETF